MLPLVLLLAIVPLVAANPGSGDVDREQAKMMLEDIYKPCILHDTNCPPGVDYKQMVPTIKIVRGNKIPSECKCDTDSEPCVRRCYYGIMLQEYEKNAVAGKTDADEIAKTRRQVRAQLDAYYKPCIVEKRNCDSFGDGIKYPDMVTQVKGTLRMYRLPEECDCDLDEEKCARTCTYAYLKLSLLGKK